MFAEIDDARMVMVDPDEQMTIIVWFGGNRLSLFDETIECIDTKTFENEIKDANDARASAEKWFDEIAEEDIDIFTDLGKLILETVNEK